MFIQLSVCDKQVNTSPAASSHPVYSQTFTFQCPRDAFRGNGEARDVEMTLSKRVTSWGHEEII